MNRVVGCQKEENSSMVIGGKKNTHLNIEKSYKVKKLSNLLKKDLEPIYKVENS